VIDQPWTVERHLEGKPEHVVACYRRLIAIVEACGPFTYAIAKSAITLKGQRRGFAGATPRPRWLDGYMDLQRPVEHPQIRRSSPYTKRLFVHHFRVTDPAELDPVLAGYLREAYAVGRGGHIA
jgi:hypothetical protein